jgi:hypothetical protein
MIRDLTNQKFGKLLVLRFRSMKNNTAHWECFCECGNTKIVSTGHLGKSTNSCGCLKREKRIASFEKAGIRYKDISGHYWSSIKQAARLREIDFAIEMQDAWHVWELQEGICVLSGEKLSFADWRSKKEQTASLDRIVSTQGYTKDNIQWVHKRINEMKNDDSDVDFVEWCAKVIRHKERKS